MGCRLAAEEYKVPRLVHRNVDIECAMENYEAWFVKIQPKMTVPCMTYGKNIIGDSKDIMHFLAKKHPGAGLHPPERKAAIDSFIDLFYSRFGMIAQFTFGNCVRISKPVRDFIDRGKTEKSIEKLKQLIKENPELKAVGEAKLMGKTRFNFVEFMMRANLKALDASMQEVLDVAETNLGKGAFMCGDTYTLADVVATAFLARIHIIKKETMFGPKTTKYWNQVIKTRPSFQQAYICSNWTTLSCRNRSPHSPKASTPPPSSGPNHRLSAVNRVACLGVYDLIHYLTYYFTTGINSKSDQKNT